MKRSRARCADSRFFCFLRSRISSISWGLRLSAIWLKMVTAFKFFGVKNRLNSLLRWAVIGIVLWVGLCWWDVLLKWVFSVMCSIHVRSPSIKLTALSVTSLVIIQHPRRAHSTLVASGNCRRYGRAILRKRRINLNHKKQPLTLFFTLTTFDGHGRRGVRPAQKCASMPHTVHIHTDLTQSLLFTHLSAPSTWNTSKVSEVTFKISIFGRKVESRTSTVDVLANCNLQVGRHSGADPILNYDAVLGSNSLSTCEN